jgi:hypothetical protein
MNFLSTLSTLITFAAICWTTRMVWIHGEELRDMKVRMRGMDERIWRNELGRLIHAESIDKWSDEMNSEISHMKAEMDAMIPKTMIEIAQIQDQVSKHEKKIAEFFFKPVPPLAFEDDTKCKTPNSDARTYAIVYVFTLTTTMIFLFCGIHMFAGFMLPAQRRSMKIIRRD